MKPGGSPARTLLPAVFVLLYAATGLLLLPGCGSSGGHTMGTPLAAATVKNPLRTVAAARRLPVGSAVTVRGTMKEKWPISGCWFSIHDVTGTIRVDTRAAGFVVVDVPLHTEITVHGKMVRQGSEVLIQAAGITF